ncbi:MAG: MFS transporter [Pseudoxanthomonas sp.]
MSATGSAGPAAATSANSTFRAVTAAVAGTVFEWFDFFLYGSLVAVFGRLFFPPGEQTAGLLAALAVFGAGWVVRPLGALFFGRLGDRIGRRPTFVITIVLMGGATVGIGLLPTYATAGMMAPILLVALRLAQGLAVGGEFGGAAIYVAEHSPARHRGLNTSLVMGTGSVGLLLALVAIMLTRSLVGESAFEQWGWRLPFLASVLLLALSVYMRLNLSESPMFQKLQAEGEVAPAPLKEAFSTPAHVKSMLLALVTLTAAQGVVWNAGTYFPLVFLQSPLGLDVAVAARLMACALLLGAPLFPLAGWLSDRYGRRPVVITGFALSALTLLPTFRALAGAVQPEFEFFTALALIWTLAIPVALVCGPAPAYLVELFPTRIRYSAIGLPYHLGNGWFGGFMPFATMALSVHFGSAFVGLYYPTAMALLCGLCALWLMPETRDRDISL